MSSLSLYWYKIVHVFVYNSAGDLRLRKYEATNV